MSSLGTSEASTLQIATFAASASLLLLPILYQGHFDSNVYRYFAWVGISFSSLGIAYRQATAWGQVRIAYNEIADNQAHKRHKEITHIRNSKLQYLILPGIREFFILWLLMIPVGLWWYILLITSVPQTSIQPSVSSFAPAVFSFAMPLAALFVIIDIFLRVIDADRDLRRRIGRRLGIHYDP